MSHSCQPVEYAETGAAFPKKYVEDPWCWSPETGFHRMSRPDAERFPRLSLAMRQVTGNAISPEQAFRLGLGAGTGTGPISTPAPMLEMLKLADKPGYAGDPDLWARLGHAARGTEETGLAEEVTLNLWERFQLTRAGLTGSFRPPSGVRAAVELFTSTSPGPYSWEVDEAVLSVTEILAPDHTSAVLVAA